MGRKPIPTEIKRARGNPGHKPLPTNEPTVTRDTPEPPKHLDRQAKAEWKRITKILAAMGVLTTGEYSALAQYCTYWSRWIEAEAKLKKEGLIVLSPNGYPQQSPWLQISNKSMEAMLKLLVEFGLTPAARTRVQRIEETSNPAILRYIEP